MMEKKKGNILIVDDNSMNVELLAATLAPLDYEILTFSNPAEALEEVKETGIDIALLDVVMPEVDGFKFAQKFLETHQNTPVIFVSAHSDNEKKIRGYNLGSFAYIEKPFDVNATRAQVQSVLNLKKMQDELFLEKEKLDSIFEFSSNEIILTGLNFNILSQNNKIIPKDKYEGKSYIDILKENGQDELIIELLHFIKSDKKHISFRCFIENQKYTKTTVSKIIPQSNHSGYLIVIEDLTEEIEMQRQRERFIEMLSHDLKTPVRAEKRALELLLDGSFGELNFEQKDMVTEILNSSRYMMRMTDNVLTRYKIDNGECKIVKTDNSIKKTIQSCVDSLKYLLEIENQTIKINSEIEDDIFAYDDIEMNRVLSNLIANASEYSGKGTLINICIGKIDNNIEISVEDQGSGIPEETLNTIFDEYTSSAKRFKKVGSGLGLYITKKIVEGHGGEIFVESKTGSGSKFTFKIPFQKAGAQQIITG